MSDAPIPSLHSLLGQRIRQATEQAGRVFDPVIGLVVDNNDPEKLGRVKVRFPTLPGQDTSTWAPMSALGAGKDRGWYFLPEIEDEVLVMFEHGDIHRPIVLGALWNGQDAPPEQNGGKNERRVLVSREGSRIVMDDAAGTITIEDGNRLGRIVITDGKITLEAKSGDAVLSAGSGAVNALASTVSIQASQSLTMGGANGLNLGADGPVTLTAPRVGVQAARLDLNPGAVPAPSKVADPPADSGDGLQPASSSSSSTPRAE
jgi:uncharacterized protein involved in type VI secretion and phage assembly